MSPPPHPKSSSTTAREIARRRFLQSSLFAGLAAPAGLAAGQSNPPVTSVQQPFPTSDQGADGALPPAHPFWPFPRLTLVTDHRKHRSRGSGLVILKDRWLFFWREASIHGASDPDSVVRMGESRNGGQTIEHIRTIYQENHGITGTDIRARLMGQGRIGVFGSRRDASNGIKGLILKPFFMYSDDGGNNWSKQVLEGVQRAMSPGFTFNRFPASVGGHDTDGYMLFCHGSGMHAVCTTDNGRTWRDRRLFDTPGGEVSVVQLGDSNRWLMTCRSASGQNPVYRSTNLLDWDGPHYSGKSIGANSSTIVYHKGHITWIAASRPYHYENDASRAIPVDGEILKGLVTCTAEAEHIWANPAQWPDWSVLMYLPAHFDGTFVRHREHWYMLFGAIEDPRRVASPGKKSYSQLGIMSSVSAPGAYFSGCLPGWIADQS